MNKEYLKKAQPIVYQTLSNALKNQRVANAYLFHGPKGSSKLETAVLFAQSIVCEHTDVDGFACQECESCKRIENEDSLDYMIVSNDRIKKKDIVEAVLMNHDYGNSICVSTQVGCNMGCSF